MPEGNKQTLLEGGIKKTTGVVSDPSYTRPPVRCSKIQLRSQSVAGSNLSGARPSNPVPQAPQRVRR